MASFYDPPDDPPILCYCGHPYDDFVNDAPYCTFHLEQARSEAGVVFVAAEEDCWPELMATIRMMDLAELRGEGDWRIAA